MKVNEILIEMKNTSELMIDLAYSALIYNNKEIAEEVLYLEETIDEMYSKLQRKAIEDSIEEKKVNSAIIAIKIGSNIERFADAALEIADVVLREIDVHPIMKESLREFDTTIIRFKIHEDSIMINKTLGGLKLASETGMWIIAIKRGKKWIFGADEVTKIDKDDIVIARGPVESAIKFEKVCNGEITEI